MTTSKINIHQFVNIKREKPNDVHTRLRVTIEERIMEI